MCGIAGWVSPGTEMNDHVKTLDTMRDIQACRGPDAAGTWINDGVALLHRRLSVLDPANGCQPMTATRNDGSTVAITYSGEVYNFREIREELASKGHPFTTSCDTEVVLHAYLEWGLTAVERFVGMFAFAVWDGLTKELHLVRDRLGIKPLYWARLRDGLLFGSEPKAILSHPEAGARMDGEGLVALFAMFGVHRPGRTPFRDVFEVRPGTTLTLRNGALQENTYWTLQAAGHTDSPEETVGRVRELLEAAVTGQLVSDVPLGCLLSGGIDSSAVAALAQQSMLVEHECLATYTVGFANQDRDFRPDADRPDLDAPWVEAVVAHLGTHHRQIIVPLDDAFEMQRWATAARDLPAMGDLDSSLLSLFLAVSSHSKVALSGEAADEVFGGYSWFQNPIATARDGFPWMMDDLGLANLLAPDLKRRLRPEEQVRSEYLSAMESAPRVDGETEGEARMRQVTHLAINNFLPVLLDRKDRTSMAVGVEVRVPFCDHRLVEYVTNVPWALRQMGGHPKGLLRTAVENLLPEAVVNRPKAMFPAVVDPAYDAAMGRRVCELLKTSRLSTLLDHERVQDLCDGNSRRPPWMRRMALAYVIQVETWLRSQKVEVDL